MERLTDKDTLRVAFDPWELCGLDNVCQRSCKGCKIPKMIRRLAAYEDAAQSPDELRNNNDHMWQLLKAEAEGRLIVLPCKIGTAVYRLDFNQHDGAWIEPHLFRLQDIDRFGNDLFLTSEEANKALEAMK